MLTTRKIGRADFFRLKGHGSAEVGAHGAFSVGRDKGEAVPIGGFSDFEATAVSTELGEAVAVELAVFTIADLAEEGGVGPEPGEGKECIAGGASGRAGRATGDATGDLFNGCGIDEDHAALVAVDGLEEGVVNLRDGIDDRAADSNNFEGIVHRLIELGE